MRRPYWLPVAVAVGFVAVVAVAAGLDKPGMVKSAGGAAITTLLAFTGTAATNTITSDTTAATMTSSVAALTAYPTAVPDANDLIFLVKSASAGNSLWRVDLEGDTFNFGNLLPNASTAVNLGSNTLLWDNAYFQQWRDSGGDSRARFQNAEPNSYNGDIANGASAIAHTFGNVTTLSTAGAKIARFCAGASTQTTCTGEVASLDKDGKLTLQASDSSASPGAATIDKPAGISAVAAGASTVVITNATVTTSSIITTNIQFVDAVCKSVVAAIPSAGSFAVTMVGVCTSNTKFGWTVTN